MMRFKKILWEWEEINGRPQGSHPTIRRGCDITPCIVGCDPCGRPLGNATDYFVKPHYLVPTTYDFTNIGNTLALIPQKMRYVLDHKHDMLSEEVVVLPIDQGNMYGETDTRHRR